MLQTLHPLALAGVYDHSNFRQDLVGRLRRTTQFVAATRYAPLAEAQRLIQRVTAIHARVRGHTPDDHAYAADDPALPTWVHVTEAYGFLQGDRRYCRAAPATIADRYYGAARGRGLGRTAGAGGLRARGAGVLRAGAAAVADGRARAVLAVLAGLRLPVPTPGLLRVLLLGAGAALPPPWADAMLGRGRRQRAHATAASRVRQRLAPLFRASRGGGVAHRACRRVGIAPQRLAHWPD
ncbi:oxygenase MpaB family protein [Xanthomonas theicola]|uniref:oxygenase MpaB family protein n=1 Tax=Xanthomonas theicola TaxID=56464 RepID=UPI001304B7E2|nr:oxygenase MpaB family protein [Xanthomonas theicola]QNH26136.1 DUF2236 domain-containing protein [Xanthomonas theicola]